MSLEAMTWAMWQDRVADPVARQVLWVLANYAQEDGRNAFCSVETMCCITRLGERTVRRKLDDLEKLGLIREGRQEVAAAYIDRADRRPKVYDLSLEPVPTKRDAVLAYREKRGAAATPRAERGAVDDTTGCRSVTNGVPLSPERGAGAAPNPSLTRPLPVKEEETPSGASRTTPIRPETQKAGAGPEQRATRLPKNWALTPELRTWAQQERPDLDVDRVAEAFRDHWIAVPGAAGRKLDWAATWRNWVRKERAPSSGHGAANGETPRQRAARERTAALTGGLLASKSPRPSGLPAMPLPQGLRGPSRPADEEEVIDV